MEIAFLGMGLMGAPMAANLLRAGHDVVVYNRTASKTEPLRALGARVAATPAAAAQGRRLIMICVEDSQAVGQVLFGEQGVANGLTPGDDPPPLVIDHSTISPAATADFAARLAAERSALYLDAPVSGGQPGAIAGTLSIMCGGPLEAYQMALPAFEAMGRTIVHIGPRHGDGQRAKIINQVLVAIHAIATDEAMRLGESLGLDMEKVLSAITQGAAGSWSLANLGPRWLARDFAPGFRLRHLLKDLGFCLEALESLPAGADQTYPGIALALDLFNRAAAAGYGEDNIHAVERIFTD